MKRGCFFNILFVLLVVLCFGLSTYFSFNFFVKGKSLPTPTLIGKSVPDAMAMCSDLGVLLSVDREHRRNSDKVPAGNIVWQNRTPGATSFIKRGSAISVQLSAGPLVLSVPDLNGQRPGTALLRLGQQNLKLDKITYFDTSDVQGIVASDPPSGTIVAAQTPVSMLVGVAASSPAFVMPDLINHPLDQVRPYLESKGLTVSTVKFEAYPGIPDGVIIRQYPLRGAPVISRDPITLVISKEEETGIIEQPGAPAAPLTSTQ
jgi:beta-lactam-binding protein with PASTA domain